MGPGSLPSLRGSTRRHFLAFEPAYSFERRSVRLVPPFMPLYMLTKKCFPSLRLLHTTGRPRSMYQQRDHLDPNKLLWDVVQDLCSADPTRETCSAVDHGRLYGSHPVTWGNSYRSRIRSSRPRRRSENRPSVRCVDSWEKVASTNQLIQPKKIDQSERCGHEMSFSTYSCVCRG